MRGGGRVAAAFFVDVQVQLVKKLIHFGLNPDSTRVFDRLASLEARRCGMKVTWIKCKSGDWCQLNTVNLSQVSAYGVYIIWHGGNPSRVVYVGQGDIAVRLAAHRTKDAIQSYSKHTLFVTWAAVDAANRDGVERYLADQWSLLVGDAHPVAAPIAVNSPW
jgi:hypothetical protein